DGVNIASRLQGLAAPDTICLSQAVYKEIEKKLPVGAVVSLGRPKLKNIAQRERVYALLPEPPKGLRQTLRVQRLKLSCRVGTAHRVAAAMLLLALVSAGSIVIKNLYFSSPAGLPLPDKPSIAVLPFTNMSGNPEQEYFSDGITEDLTTDLSKIASLFVISRNSAFTYKGKAVKVQEVSRELGVHYVLEGSVRRSDSQIRITAQLIDALTGGHMWSERYERPLHEIFAVQDEIRQQIVFALKVKLAPEEQERFRTAPTNNLEAYDYYLRGVELPPRGTKEAIAQRRQMFEKAIELDPQYAAAYASLSNTYWIEWFVGWSQDPQTLKRGFELAQKAVALDDSLPIAHSILGFVYLIMKQHDKAIAEAERAIALDPNFADGYATLATILGPAGRPEEAIRVAQQAMRLNPHYLPWYLNALGMAYLSAGRYEEAIAPLQQAISRNPNDWAAHVNLAVVYSELGREEEARAEVAEAQRISPVPLEVWRQRNLFKDPVVRERYLAALGKAWPK
ncbi:MAG: tetratricopeptide repeat protein, partial [Deltaproteobacteria bacterium]|nr:tetratricopeptide repeat protein [Deltaproteobacteria bacterium]